MDEYYSSQPAISQLTTGSISLPASSNYISNYNGINLRLGRISPNALVSGGTLSNGTTIKGSLGLVPGTSATTSTSTLDLSVDFTRPDSQRTRPLLIDGKRLYVDEHYVSVWSPILRSWCIECPDRELILADVQYDHVLELLIVIDLFLILKLICLGNLSNIQTN